MYTTLSHTILHYFIHYTSYSFSALIGAHQRDTAVGLVNGENPRLKNPLLSSECKAVYQAPAPHNTCSTTTCAGKVDQELPVNQSKGHAYTNPRPSHYLTHAHIHITRAVAAMDSRFSHGIAVGHWLRKTRVQRPFPAEASPLSASFTQHMWKLLTGNRTAALPRHARGRRIMGLV